MSHCARAAYRITAPWLVSQLCAGLHAMSTRRHAGQPRSADIPTPHGVPEQQKAAGVQRCTTLWSISLSRNRQLAFKSMLRRECFCLRNPGTRERFLKNERSVVNPALP